MTRSMTAFAAGSGASPLGTLNCELRSVNHRFLEQSLHVPEALHRVEPAVRERVASRLARGKVDLTLRLAAADGAARPVISHARLGQLAALMLELDTHFPSMRVNALELLAYPGMLEAPPVDNEALQGAVLTVVDAALDGLIATREREGAKLAAVIGERLDGVADLTSGVRKLVPEIEHALHDKLETRLAAVKAEVEPGRLEQELALQVMHADVAEELDRLDTHVSETRRVLQSDEPVGRRLDFLLQEFNREANTLGSKAADGRITAAVVELKVLIEQMREQVQNVE